MQSVKLKILEPELFIVFSLYKGRKTIYDLAVELPYAKSTIYYNVRKLQAEGLVEEINGVLQLTPKGEEIVKRIKKMICEG